MSLSIIVAHDKHRLIGVDNSLPWSLPADLQYFKSKTLNKVCIQGRKTFESIISQLGKPLPFRTNIILTSDTSYQVEYDNCYVYNSAADILNEYKRYGFDTEVFVIGGNTLFTQFLPYVDRLYITYIDHEFEGDCYFPEVDYSQFKLISSKKGVTDKHNPYRYYFNVFDRV